MRLLGLCVARGDLVFDEIAYRFPRIPLPAIPLSVSVWLRRFYPGRRVPENEKGQRSINDTLFFVVNASLSTLFCMLCVVSLAAADNPFAIIGGLVFVLPAAAYSIAEWRCRYRRQHWLKRPLGVVNLLLAAFVVFALVTNVGEAVLAEDPIAPAFMLIFGLGSAVVAGYFAYCGWRRVQGV